VNEGGVKVKLDLDEAIDFFVFAMSASSGGNVTMQKRGKNRLNARNSRESRKRRENSIRIEKRISLKRTKESGETNAPEPI
jgi:hypothetical protein